MSAPSNRLATQSSRPTAVTGPAGLPNSRHACAASRVLAGPCARLPLHQPLTPNGQPRAATAKSAARRRWGPRLQRGLPGPTARGAVGAALRPRTACTGTLLQPIAARGSDGCGGTCGAATATAPTTAAIAAWLIGDEHAAGPAHLVAWFIDGPTPCGLSAPPGLPSLGGLAAAIATARTSAWASGVRRHGCRSHRRLREEPRCGGPAGYRGCSRSCGRGCRGATADAACGAPAVEEDCFCSSPSWHTLACLRAALDIGPRWPLLLPASGRIAEAGCRGVPGLSGRARGRGAAGRHQPVLHTGPVTGGAEAT